MSTHTDGMLTLERTLEIALEHQRRGAGSGMGLLSAQKFAESGASVAMLDINEEAIKTKAEKLTKEGYSVLPIKCNVREFDEIKAAVELTKKTFGRIDYTLSFAGGYAGRILNDSNNLEEVRPETIEWSLDVNLRAPIYMAMSAFEYLKENGGVVIHLGSITGHDGNAPAYSPAKYGLVAFTKKVAIQAHLMASVPCAFHRGPCSQERLWQI